MNIWSTELSDGHTPLLHCSYEGKFKDAFYEAGIVYIVYITDDQSWYIAKIKLAFDELEKVKTETFSEVHIIFYTYDRQQR